MKRLGWVVFAVACGHKSPAPLPVAAPPPLTDVTPVQPPDAAVGVDAGPDPAAVKAAEQAKQIAERHDRCVEHAAKSAADLPPLPPANKRKPTAAVALVAVADVNERYNPTHGVPIEGWWSGESTRKKLAPKVSALTSCYAQALARNPDLNGGITIGATLLEDGTLDTPRVIDDLVGDTELQKCVVDKFGTLKIPGGSKTAFGFEALFDLVFCPPERNACLVVVQAPPPVKPQIKVALQEHIDRVGACYKAAGKSHARGTIERIQQIDPAGVPNISRGDVLPFAGDDPHATAYQQASDCDNIPWSLICLDPRSDVDTDKTITVHTWMQR